MFKDRFTVRTALACAIGASAVVGTVSAAPGDFSDDFNDGILEVSWLRDNDGNLMTALDQTPLSVWVPSFGSSSASQATAIEVQEKRGPGELRFRSGRNQFGNSFAGYASNLWTIDPLDPIDDPTQFPAFLGMPNITLPTTQVEAIRAQGLRVIGKPDDFAFTIEAKFGYNVINGMPSPLSGADPERAIYIAFVENGSQIGYAGEFDPQLVDDGVIFTIENVAGSPGLTFALRQYADAQVVQESAQPYGVFGDSFDGLLSFSYTNTLAQQTLSVTITDRSGLQTTVSLSDVFRTPDEVEGAPIISTGACCLDGNMCVDNTQADICEASGGEFRGAGSSCGMGMCEIDNDMNDPPLGACCLPGMPPMCVETDAVACLMMGGSYRGDGEGCVGRCIPDEGGDGITETTTFLSVPRIDMYIGAFSERADAKLRPRKTRFDKFDVTALNHQLDANFADPTVTDLNMDGMTTAVDMAAALDAFPPASDAQIEAILLAIDQANVMADPNAVRLNPAFYLRDRQYFRAVGRWYKQEVLPLFAGERSQREKRADRRRLKDIRDFFGS